MASSKLSVKVGVNSRLLFEQEGDPMFALGFMRTLRIPDDGLQYRLPPSLGTFPLRRAKDYPEKVPTSWLQDNVFFLPIYQREAMWVSFVCRDGKPHAVKVAVGDTNALTGKDWTEELVDQEPPDYLVCPNQLWLDGSRTEKGVTRQFLGDGETGPIRLRIYPPKPGVVEPPTFPVPASSVFLFPSNHSKVPKLVSRELVDNGLLTEAQLLEAEQTSVRRGNGLLPTLTKWVDPLVLEEMTAKANASLLNVPYESLDDPDPELRRLIPSDLARRYNVFPVSQIDANTLTLAMLDPCDVIAVDDIMLITGFNIEVAQASFSAIRAALQTYGDENEGGPARGDVACLDTASAYEPQPGESELLADHALEIFDLEGGTDVEVFLVDITTWARITGEDPPATPVSSAVYTNHGYLWLDTYEDDSI